MIGQMTSQIVAVNDKNVTSPQYSQGNKLPDVGKRLVITKVNKGHSPLQPNSMIFLYDPVVVFLLLGFLFALRGFVVSVFTSTLEN